MTEKLSDADEAGRKAVFQWLADCFAICTNDCPSCDLRDWKGCGGVNLVFMSGGTSSESLEWRAESWAELAKAIYENPDGIIYDED